MKLDLSKYNGQKSLSNVIKYFNEFYTTIKPWETCPSGDMLLDLVELLEFDRRKLVGCAGECAGTVRYLMTDPRSTAAVDACAEYAAGKIGDRELKKVYKGALDVSTEFDAKMKAFFYSIYDKKNIAFTDILASAEAANSALSAVSYVNHSYNSAELAGMAVSAYHLYEAKLRKANQLATANIVRKWFTDDLKAKLIELGCE